MSSGSRSHESARMATGNTVVRSPGTTDNEKDKAQLAKRLPCDIHVLLKSEFLRRGPCGDDDTRRVVGSGAGSDDFLLQCSSIESELPGQ